MAAPSFEIPYSENVVEATDKPKSQSMILSEDFGLIAQPKIQTPAVEQNDLPFSEILASPTYAIPELD